MARLRTVSLLLWLFVKAEDPMVLCWLQGSIEGHQSAKNGYSLMLMTTRVAIGVG